MTNEISYYCQSEFNKPGMGEWWVISEVRFHIAVGQNSMSQEWWDGGWQDRFPIAVSLKSPRVMGLEPHTTMGLKSSRPGGRESKFCLAIAIGFNDCKDYFLLLDILLFCFVFVLLIPAKCWTRKHNLFFVRWYLSSYLCPTLVRRGY